ncbi:unnamed protein product [Ilex paraguariensis]|uniref:Uncharacterized protein n=1 Tax=Ilex paraguariensis TaxID=185542 RepID=A0ABC8RTT7_9AQUA
MLTREILPRRTDDVTGKKSNDDEKKTGFPQNHDVNRGYVTSLEGKVIIIKGVMSLGKLGLLGTHWECPLEYMRNTIDQNPYSTLSKCGTIALCCQNKHDNTHYYIWHLSQREARDEFEVSTFFVKDVGIMHHEVPPKRQKGKDDLRSHLDVKRL